MGIARGFQSDARESQSDAKRQDRESHFHASLQVESVTEQFLGEQRARSSERDRQSHEFAIARTAVRSAVGEKIASVMTCLAPPTYWLSEVGLAGVRGFLSS